MKLKIFAVVLICTLIFALPVSGKVRVSPALDVIAASKRMVKSVSAEASGLFSANDFDTLLGCRVASVTLTSLPEASQGKLLLGTTPVITQQSISREYLDILSFVASGTSSGEASFGFSCTTENGEYRTGCTLYIHDTQNTAPTSAGLAETLFEFDVQCNITSFGRLRALDAEGNEISYEITSLPENGVMTLSPDGAFRYTPNENYVGYDSFSYTASDKYGAVSDVINVSIEIKESQSGVFYSDLGSHWAHSSAIELTDRGVMTGTVKSGMRFFEPDKKMTASEFTVAAMKAMGYELDDVVGAETVFWDNGDIPKGDIAYVAEAASLGYIDGKENKLGKLCFYPNQEISRAEAAVLMSRMLNSKQAVYRAVFADETDIPAYALEAIYTMNSLGIMDGTGGTNIAANDPVTRAEAAVMLDRMADIPTEK